MKISGQIVDIHNRVIYGGIVTVSDGKIASIEKCEDAGRDFILPGFIDSHVHIESSMVAPSQFAVTAVKHGTVAVVSDPHEIANVMGIKGVEFMIEDAAGTPLKFLFGAPSCVPATSFETSGAMISAEETAKLLDNPAIGYLAEMMNFPGIVFGDKEVCAKTEAARRAGKPIDGHAPGLSGEQLEKYVAAGISTDHECSTFKEAEEKIKLGMKVLIREGSAAKNMDALKEVLKFYPDMVMLCSDDLHPEMLEKGHINLLAARLIREGFDVFDVLRSVTLNPDTHYKLETGLLRTGDSADFIVTGDLKTMKIAQTWIKGRCVYDGETLFKAPGIALLNNFNASAVAEDELKVEKRGKSYRIIKAYNGELLTDCITAEAGSGDFVESNTEADILKIVVKDRYNDSHAVVGFITGFGLHSGAFATSVAHDSHNVIAIGADDTHLAEAMNMVIKAKGGMAVVNCDEKKFLPLPLAGIMSDEPVEKVAKAYEELSEAVKKMGCKMDAPFMTLSFMALLVIPKLKIGDKGLFDVTTFSPTTLFID